MYELSISTIIDGHVYKPEHLYSDAHKKSGSEVFDLLHRICVSKAEHYYSLYKINSQGFADHIADRASAQHALDLYATLSGVQNPLQLFKDRIYQTLPDSIVTDSDLMIAWEWILEQRDHIPYLADNFAKHGTCEMRDLVAGDTQRIISILNKLDANNFKGRNITLQVPYDWVLIPALLNQYYRHAPINDTQLSILFAVALCKL